MLSCEDGIYMRWPGPPDTLFHYVSSLRLATITLLIIVTQFASIPLRLLLPPLIPLITLCSSKSPSPRPKPAADTSPLLA